MLRLPVATFAARKNVLCALATAAIFALGLGSSPALAEFQASLYGGWNGSFDSDFHLIQPNGTNMILNDVPWDGDSFGAPPYWGIRGTYWFNNAPNWGFMVDYHHAKVFFTTLGGSESVAKAEAGLLHASGFLRSQLAKGLTLRIVPELHFIYDESVERGIRLSNLIDDAIASQPEDVDGEKS